MRLSNERQKELLLDFKDLTEQHKVSKGRMIGNVFQPPVYTLIDPEAYNIFLSELYMWSPTKGELNIPCEEKHYLDSLLASFNSNIKGG